ncbi:hypothetical protein [Archangium lansingense]|uniref:DUF2076 domain-containing protein n=1 Tax=Archangium lansingense TaxID=2995310 RepID=A0ABT4AI70_9BACT|nr:hypothetical protein [Archangium lansinium]MCY1081368.1 hypothetical protein [Archangium lansinium]
MGFLDRIFGGGSSTTRPSRGGPAVPSADEQALARYRYLLRTAPPEAIEQAHAEAFAQLTPEQRAQVLRELGQELPPAERRAAASNDPDPRALARMATRAELRQPGTLERSFGGSSLGGMFAGSLLGSIAGTVIGSAIAHQFLGGFDEGGWGEEGGLESAQVEDAAADDTGFGDDVGGDLGDFDV